MPDTSVASAVSVGVVVDSVPLVAARVRLLTLRPTDAPELPSWELGAHIAIDLPNGLRRQYSLCGDPADRTQYQIAVLLSRESRGGSSSVHSDVDAGCHLDVHGPVNGFPFHEARSYFFLAGGIGITPLRQMIAEADRVGAPWRLVYAGRRLADMAFAEELTTRYPDNVTLVPSARGRVDAQRLMAEMDLDTVVYACGPGRLLDDVNRAARKRPELMVRTERFFADAPGAHSPRTAFDVELVRSGKRIRVSPDCSALQAIEAAGIQVPSVCRAGTCGTCETEVLAGRPDHRDMVLSEAERESGEVMMVCVSRSLDPTLALNL